MTWKTPRFPRLSRRAWFRVALIACVAALAALVAFAAAELAARRYMKDCWGFFGPDPVLGWSFHPGRQANALFASGNGKVRKVPIRINSHGLRDREIPYDKSPDAFRILCIGDSYVEAFQVPLEDVFTKRLERALEETRGGDASAATRYEVVSAGNGNYGTDQELLFYENEGRKYRPDAVILFFFPLNDFSDNVAELNDRAYFAKTFYALDPDGGVRPSAEPVMPPLSERTQRANVWGRFARRWQSYLFATFYVRAYAPRTAGVLEDLGLIPRALSKTPDGYYTLWDIDRRPLSPEWRNAVDVTRGLVAEMKRRVEQDGARFRAVVIPFAEVLTDCFPDETRRLWPHFQRPDMDPTQSERLAREMFRAVGAPTLDLAPAFEKAIRETGESTYVLPDGHLSEFGHRVVAQALLDFLRDLGDVPSSASLRPAASAPTDALASAEPTTWVSPEPLETDSGGNDGALSFDVPPLGLDDAAQRIERVRDLLGDAPSTPSLSAQEEAAGLATRCALYMELIAENRNGRSPYKWRRIGKPKRIPSGPATIREFKIAAPIGGATAIRLRALYRDVQVEQIVVQNASGESRTIPLDRWIRARLPRGETILLDLPTEVSRVFATCRHEDTRLPRLGIEIGVPEEPDYAREIAFLCHRVAEGIETGDWDLCRDAVSTALNRLSEFRADPSAKR
ncbi:SGNH/GDSL hydrolase family protein [Candidatus Sumerlaeota bacterium]|nr:SGNH/GDSL hydrolase family protein [Candidatus Sumerlaeota bacterium]